MALSRTHRQKRSPPYRASTRASHPHGWWRWSAVDASARKRIAEQRLSSIRVSRLFRQTPRYAGRSHTTLGTSMIASKPPGRLHQTAVREGSTGTSLNFTATSTRASSTSVFTASYRGLSSKAGVHGDMTQKKTKAPVKNEADNGEEQTWNLVDGAHQRHQQRHLAVFRQSERQ